MPNPPKDSSEASLKSERIQLKSERIQLKSERIQMKLQEVPGWVLSDSGQQLVRTYHFTSPRTAAAFSFYVSHLAADIVLEPLIITLGFKVEVRTPTDEATGLSDRDFELARWIDGSYVSTPE